MASSLSSKCPRGHLLILIFCYGLPDGKRNDVVMPARAFIDSDRISDREWPFPGLVVMPARAFIDSDS